MSAAAARARASAALPHGAIYGLVARYPPAIGRGLGLEGPDCDLPR